MKSPHELAPRMKEKTDQELLAMLGSPADWTLEALDVAKAELQSRKVDTSSLEASGRRGAPASGGAGELRLFGIDTNYAEIRRLLLKSFIGFLSLTALIALWCVLLGSFSDIVVRVLLTTFSISAGSICAMSCAAFVEKKGEKGAGFAGILAAVVAVLLVSRNVWGDHHQWDEWKLTATFIVIAIAFAHGCLLRLPNLDQRHRWTQTVSTLLVALLALQIVWPFWREVHDRDYYRFLGAMSVLVVLVTLIIPICGVLRSKAGESRRPRCCRAVASGFRTPHFAKDVWSPLYRQRWPHVPRD